MAVSLQHRTPEIITGFQYDYDIDLGAEPLDDVHTWKDDAVCHGMSDLFDLATEIPRTKEERAGIKQDNRYKLAAARPLCFSCPVFEECWNDAYDNGDVGVIRAGALLNHELRAIRIKRLVIAWDIYMRLKKRKKNE